MSWSGLPEKLEKYIMPEPNSGCWLWVGGLRSKVDGYGGVGWGGKTWRSHRLVYTLLCNPVLPEQDIDHLCRNRSCCNPGHLEACSRKTNILRGVGIAAVNVRKTHCGKGHLLAGSNLIRWKTSRYCRICCDVHKKAHYARKKKELTERRQYKMAAYALEEMLDNA